MPASRDLAERLVFLRGYLRAPGAVGSVTPSSLSLGRRMARLAHVDRAASVLELGAGTGSVTRALLEALPAGARLWAFEIDGEFARGLRARFDDPRLEVVERSAADAPAVMERAGVRAVDAVVSALPFSLLGRDVSRSVLDAAARVMRPGAALVALQYNPWYLAPLLRERFGTLERRLWLWNLPPAVLLRAHAPGPR
ncbi:MAG TPA: methyltransferase domain-containing protein [Solirubrobacteraceae bacterium]|nr:methyltransferase domain-containing protein [Solirubrobacteraceae bacterium]